MALGQTGLNWRFPCPNSLSLSFPSPKMASGAQDKQYTPSLLSFFIYNPTFGPREGEVRGGFQWRTSLWLLCQTLFWTKFLMSHFFLSGREKDFVLSPQWDWEEWEDQKCGPLRSHCSIHQVQHIINTWFHDASAKTIFRSFVTKTSNS